MFAKNLKNSNYTTICIMISATLENYSRGRGTFSSHLSAHLKVQGRILAGGIFSLSQNFRKKWKLFWRVAHYWLSCHLFSNIFVIFSSSIFFVSTYGMKWKTVKFKIFWPPYQRGFVKNYNAQIHIYPSFFFRSPISLLNGIKNILKEHFKFNKWIATISGHVIF
jgi:hypothetical protein